MEARQITPFFSSNFFTQIVCDFHFNHSFKKRQNSCSYGSLVATSRSVKCLKFGQKLSFWTVHHTFLESSHSEITKNPYCILSPQRSQRKISAHGMLIKVYVFSLWYFIKKLSFGVKL